MRRRAPSEKVEPWRLRINGPEADTIRARLLDWSSEAAQHVAWPDMPEGIEDRNADVWEALLAVADLAGGEWPERARCSAVTLVTASSDRGGSLGVILLRDLHRIFAGHERLSTEHILDCLHEVDESPWADLRGKPLDSRGLARRLAKYDVKPKLQRVDGQVIRGYEATDLADPWSRYVTAETDPFGKLPDPPSGLQAAASHPSGQEAVTSVTPLHADPCADCGAERDNAALLSRALTCTTCEINELTA
nr:DUF3631 domain-containing protein [Nocardioides lijunqiniae]